MIGVDWGTTNLRAWRFGPDGTIRDRLAAPEGLLSGPPGGFPATLLRHAGAWIADGETTIIMCGMVGSRQGWAEAAYLPCPADPALLAASLTEVAIPGARAFIIPGLSCRDAWGRPDVARGEETKGAALIARLGQASATLVLPGTHGKWMAIADGRITGFMTHMTGEVFSALSTHTILARTLDAEAPHDAAAFAAGVTQAREPTGLLHHIFTLRAASLLDGMTPAASLSHLSGLLIGSEILAGTTLGAAPFHVLAESGLGARYVEAFGVLGIPCEAVHGDVTPAGLFAIGGLL
ncbi:2-dehydro-3-deoxygalactonokinase [Humitalea sp. 24SJ18S-53]|uniref:2-dehydro-3-deoxygalactonokinase n=1 Tax=Humitalea sp. 24SJ18S-53 TaxID=3422307 RepID=UPI003D679650